MRLLGPKERDTAFKKEKDNMRLKASELTAEFSKLLKSYNITKEDLENFYERKVILKDNEDKIKFQEENLQIRENNARIKEKEVLELKEECNVILNNVLELEQKLIARAKAITDKEIKFNNFRELQESLLSKDKQKLRHWLEEEKKKLEICHKNYQE